MAGKQPTARGISILLTRAGFDRYRHTLLRVWPGHEVTSDAPGQVRVDYRGGHVERAQKLGEYAAAIREAGWSVHEADFWLVVTAKGKTDG